eukprot:TRINITY_DN6854_c0_g1_i2.p1 TRINITY_DN6854_c0_g1~~TRINITY_DN6854_c0_g1_i2.p1  ORF type:complete len:345 (-),score=50.90 TRINITY_DN6854_c0_g1_i2:168-1202(-)
MLDLWTTIYIKAVGAFELFDNVVKNISRNFGQNNSNERYNKMNVNDKIVIITGGNAGIGKATAQHLADQGAHVILACRSLERANKAITDIKNQLNKNPIKIDARQLDLSSFKSIRQFVKDFRGDFDILICNAGVMVPPQRIITEDGFEQQFQVNYLGHWLLANLLMQKTKNQKQERSKRIVMLSSMTHRAGDLNPFDEDFLAKKYEPFEWYAKSKLAILLGTKEFQRRFNRLNIGHVAIACHPGLVMTEMAKGYFLEYLWPSFLHGVVKATLGPMLPYMLLTPQQSCQNVLEAIIVENDVAKGGHIADMKFVEPSKKALDVQLARDLWTVSEKLVGEQFLSIDM